MSRGSAVWGFAHDQWRATRYEFETVRAAAYEHAVDETNGALLNDRGRAKGIDAYHLFIGPEARANAYASEALRDHWARYPRLTFAEFERQTFDAESWEDAS
jgi:hypothetical protein